ncbi:MAG: hypothetical protein OXC18_20775 [Desulfurellaceae bacterium]|nr:hypothetical protein [Desulfurellaceae bacterium]
MRATAFTCVWFLLLVHVAGGTEVPLTDVPVFDRDNPKAGGIILSFHHWPDEKEAAAILRKTTAAGLNKTKEFERFKAWVFEWPELREGREAQEMCDSLPELPSLERCEPDYVLGPAESVG